MLRKDVVKKLLVGNIPLLGILVAVMLISISIGPFQNWDTNYEFQAAMGVIKWGMPYIDTFGSIASQPPLGFQIEALFFRIFGASIPVGTLLVTLFGLGSTIFAYLIGKKLYGKSTGLVAAALFALNPWELVLTRSFLIDAQYLFLSLVCLYFGIFAVNKDSIKLALVSGVFFAAAFLTKFFAVYILIPLLLYYVYSKPKNLIRVLTKLTVFILPMLLCSLLWYQVILGQDLLYIFHNIDFISLNNPGVVPSYTFVATFLLNESLGYFFVIAVAFSLLVYFLFRKEFPKIYIFDLICLGTILPILIVNTVLGAGLNLDVPYHDAIKYDYSALPFFCFIAASLFDKCHILFNSTKVKNKLKNPLKFAVIITSALLLAAIVIVDVVDAHILSLSDYLLFYVQMNQNNGYNFFNYSPISQHILLMNIQYVGFAVFPLGLLWASRHKFHGLFKLTHRWINGKKAL
ncbi:MAG TPA: glycosyltransferase family 39 protein [Verrucomicrobiae bacterium]|nr:glycosyltransferase family 39 protein [Verrucomicrobiae bacterium]